MPYYSRKNLRLPGFDYSSIHYYFITVCTYDRACLFGCPNQVNDFGSIVTNDILAIADHHEGVRVDHFVVMPNHIHMILVLEGEGVKRPTVSQIMALFKAGVSRKIRMIAPDLKIWQRSFYEHIIRNRQDYEKIWEYIENNPKKWELDRFYLGRDGSRPYENN